VGKKINLPVLAEVFGDPTAPKATAKTRPSVDAARAKLGGRPEDDGPPPGGVTPGAVVSIRAAGGARQPAAVVFASAREAHVLLDGVRLRRISPAEVSTHDGVVPADLARVAADARVFATLSGGQHVRYADDAGELRSGRLVEKCRYGGLVRRDDGVVIAVGFRKLWPAAAAEES
jgi:hypothetical protein